MACIRQNRMDESLILFESVVNSRWFSRTSIILFLTRIDEFKEKLPKVYFRPSENCTQHRTSQVPLESYFPEYTGGPDINKAAKYILWKFMQMNRAHLSTYPQCVFVPSSSSLPTSTHSNAVCPK